MDITNLFNVKDKVVLITGGAKGIGRMIAEGYVTAGSNVYIASRDLSSLEQATDELNKLGKGRCSFIQADLSTVEGVDKVVKELGEKEDHLNILINNAGANWGAPLSTYPDSAFTKVLTLNLQRVFTLSQRLVPLLSLGSNMGSNDPARIINIGSVDGVRVPRLETYAYSASKAALHQLSRVLASHLGPEGITSNVLACGAFPSKMMAATLEKSRPLIISAIPLGRIGTPEDITGACLFLSSRAGAWVNGAQIALDGGALVSSKM